MSEGYCEVSGIYCDSLDEHHIIPREYGGINGPTVKLSPTIHQTIHRIHRNPAKVAAFISRYPQSTKLIHHLIDALNFADSTLDRVQCNKITININSFNEKERNLLLKAAETENITIAKLIVKIIKKVLN